MQVDNNSPHHFIIEISEIRKTNVSIYAHSFEEARKLIMDLSDEEANSKIQEPMDADPDGYYYKIVKEDKNNRYVKPCIDEFNVRS